MYTNYKKSFIGNHFNFKDDQTFSKALEDSLQRLQHQFSAILVRYSMEISTSKIKTLTF
jgi:hypothetical protein